jgi:DNA helicase HerA-like ATPase
MSGMHIGKSRDSNEPILLPPSLLSKHVAILGSIGSGKTVAAKVLLEEATLAGIPSIIIDPQGDIAKMAFKESIPELKKNNVDQSRAQILDEKAEFRIWTPASELGLPLSINPFGSAPTLDGGFDRNTSASIAAIDLMAAGFAAICGYSETNKSAQVKGFLNEILMHATEKKNMPESFNQLAVMVANIQEQLEIMGLDVEAVKDTIDLITEADRKELARRLRSLNTGVNRLLFQSGVALDPQTLVTPIEDGYTPVNIILISTLPDDDTKQKFVAELSRSLYAWGNKSSEALKIVYFVDEAHQFIPSTSIPASHPPLLNLFRRGRHCGIACIVATQQLTDIDYKALSNVNTKLIGRVTDPRERKSVQDLFANAHNRKESLDSLSNLQPGEFMLLCPEIDRVPIPIDIRWLYRKHGRPITEKEIKKIVNSKQRKWAKNVQDGLEHRLSGLRTYQPPEISNPSDAASNEIEEELDLEDDAPTNSSIESQDSVFAGDVTQRTIHGAENVNINFNLGKAASSEEKEIGSQLKSKFSVNSFQSSDDLTQLTDRIITNLNGRKEVLLAQSREKSDFPGTGWEPQSQFMNKMLFTFSFAFVTFVVVIELIGGFMSEFEAFKNNLYSYRTGMDLIEAMISVKGIRWACFVVIVAVGIEFIVTFFIPPFKKQWTSYFEKEQHDVHKALKELDEAMDEVSFSFRFRGGLRQTNDSEYKLLGYIDEFDLVLLKRRVHRKFTTSKEAKDWISGLEWDQTVTVSSQEFTSIILGTEPLELHSDWAKREVVLE